METQVPKQSFFFFNLVQKEPLPEHLAPIEVSLNAAIERCLAAPTNAVRT